MNILVTGAWKCTQQQIDSIQKLGHNVLFLDQEQNELPCDYMWVEGAICNGLFLYHDITKFINLKYIQTTSAGLDRIPLDYCNEHNIIVNNARGVYSIPMAEFAISGVLDIFKKKKEFFIHQAEHCWFKERGLLELFGKTVLIIGCGSVGIECAKRFKAFGCTIYGLDKAKADLPYFDSVDDLTNLEDTISNADIIAITIPHNNKTTGLINIGVLKKAKKNAIIVNISRGKIINENDLVFALNHDMIAGAVLDVFDEEPLNGNSLLWDMKNVIITPHNSFDGDNNSQRLFELIYNNLRLPYGKDTD